MRVDQFVQFVVMGLFLVASGCSPRSAPAPDHFIHQQVDSLSLPLPSSSPSDHSSSGVTDSGTPPRRAVLARFTARQHLSQSQFQEAIWIAHSTGEEGLGDQIRADLRTRMDSETYEHAPMRLAGLGQKAVLRFSSGFFGIFKPNDEGPYLQGRAQNPNLYASEVAAYELDRLLDLNVVPLTVPHQLRVGISGFAQGLQGSLQYKVDTEHLGMEIGRSRRSLEEQMQSQGFQAMQILDYLSGNVDRTNQFNNDNWIDWPAENRIIAIDHGIAFQDRQGGCIPQGTNQLYWGFNDPIRISIAGPGLNEGCLLSHLRERANPQGRFMRGILGEVNFNHLSRNTRNRIRDLTYAQFQTALGPYVSNEGACLRNRNRTIPHQSFQTTGCLDLAWGRLMSLRVLLGAIEESHE